MMGNSMRVETATVTTGAFALTYTLGDAEVVDGLYLSINTAPTSAGSITVTLDAKAGAAYDTLLRTIDPVATSMTSLWLPINQSLVTGDKITVAYANPDNRTVSGQIYHDPSPDAAPGAGAGVAYINGDAYGDLDAIAAILTTIDADTGTLTSAYTGATTSHRKEEIDPLSAQYGTTSVISNEAVATALDTTTAWQAVGGYGPLSLQIYLLGGVGAAAANRTVTLTVEATNGGTVAAATDAIDITESCKSLLTGLDSAASYTSTGATAYRDILTLRREDSNFTHYRIAYVWDDAPSVTAGAIVVTARNAAI